MTLIQPAGTIVVMQWTRYSSQSWPFTLPSAGMQTRSNVTLLIEALTARTLPSDKPAIITPACIACGRRQSHPPSRIGPLWIPPGFGTIGRFRALQLDPQYPARLLDRLVRFSAGLVGQCCHDSEAPGRDRCDQPLLCYGQLEYPSSCAFARSPSNRGI